MQRRTEMSLKSKWVSSANFRTIGGKQALRSQELNFIPNFVHRTPSQPALMHQHRDVDKSKFIDGKDFKVC